MKTLIVLYSFIVFLFFTKQLSAQVVSGIGLGANYQLLDSPDANVIMPEINLMKKLNKRIAFLADVNYVHTRFYSSNEPEISYRKRLMTQIGFVVNILPLKYKWQFYFAPKYCLLHRNENLYAGFALMQSGPEYYYKKRFGFVSGSMISVGTAHKLSEKSIIKVEARVYTFHIDNTVGLSLGYIYSL